MPWSIKEATLLLGNTFMPHLKREPIIRWLRRAGTQRQAILGRKEDIDTPNNRGSQSKALEAKLGAIELSLQSLADAVLSGANRAEVIKILNTSIDFCAAHLADEEGLMPKGGHAGVNAHCAANKGLLAGFVSARRSASGEGLSMATLDTVDLLHAFHNHVRVWDRSTATVVPKHLNGTHATAQG